jgi:hypothetical protein
MEPVSIGKRNAGRRGLGRKQDQGNEEKRSHEWLAGAGTSLYGCIMGSVSAGRGKDGRSATAGPGRPD